MSDIESLAKQIVDLADKHSIPLNEVIDMLHEHVQNIEKERLKPKKKKRKIQYYNDESRGIWTYMVKGESNPCGCGSNCYHKEYEPESETLFCVCNACRICSRRLE